jgi:O-antigen/teichoic acid export membrane protein
MQDDLQEMSRALIKLETLIGAVISPIIAFFVISPGMILGILYGKQYSEASLPLAILMVTAIVRLYSGVLMQIFFALGRPNSHRTFALIRLIAALIIIYPAIITFGMSGGPLTIFFCFSFLLGLQLAWTEKKLGFKVLAQLTAISKGLVFAMVVVVPGMAIKSAYPENILVVISAGITLTILSWIIAARSYLVPIVK